MKRSYWVSVCLAVAAILFISFTNSSQPEDYRNEYSADLAALHDRLLLLQAGIAGGDLTADAGKQQVRVLINDARGALKAFDIWGRYLEPQAYRQMNGPLPVEWETEVFEKFEKPYKREGAGLALATMYLDERQLEKDTLLRLVNSAIASTAIYAADSITKELATYHHFYLCNRLLLLNLAAIYTTGFECPDGSRVVPELRAMLTATTKTYAAFNKSFPATSLPQEYLSLFDSMRAFVATQPDDHEQFDHYNFIRNYVCPLFAMNQQLVLKYNVVSHSLLDYSLNKKATSIFDKALYNGQNVKGIYSRVTDTAVLAEIEHVGKLLFYDPILSGNDMRSCASCHKPTQYFTDTQFATALHYDRSQRLTRNSPSLVNVVYNHLLMLDGKHFTLQNQGKDVISNHNEMMCNADDVVRKVMSCKEYKHTFKSMLAYTPQEPEVTMDHIVSAISLYYSKFSKFYAPFDRAMNRQGELTGAETRGFNLFMGKAQCATCHFVPQFNGVKPPYIGSEFEVLGVPADIAFGKLSPDEGRYGMNPAEETRNAFRTSTVRNAAHTAPYMHNGVFRTLEQVVDMYDAGGGAGRGLAVGNQTLSAEPLHLTPTEKQDLIAFMRSLDEDIAFEPVPKELPRSGIKALNTRKSGGEY